MGTKSTKATERIVLSRNENAIKNEIQTLTALKDKLNTIKTLYRSFTEGECEKVSMQGLRGYLKDKTGFDNPKLTSELLNKKEAYYELVELFELADSKHTEKLTKRGNTWQLEPKTVKLIEDSHTSYMSERVVDEYQKLLQAVEILKTMKFAMGFQSIKYDPFNGGLNVDAKQFNAAYLLRGR